MGVRPADHHHEAAGGSPPAEDFPRTRPARGRGPAARVIAAAVRDVGPREAPALLCATAVDLLPVNGASVSLYGGGLPVRLGASSGRAAWLTELQATLGDGPCPTAARTGAPAFAADLTCGEDLRRWPLFAHEAALSGVRAAYSLPLGSGPVCVGTLDLYRDTPGVLGTADLDTALLVAAVMTAALTVLPHDGDGDLPGGDRWLNGLAADHDEVHQATGMVMARLGVGPDEALARLRAHAFAHDRTVLQTARDVVTHGVGLDDLP
ncbi:GAF and ANTAR domain-containing protein [Streptomyces sp. NPDC090106]|uniref:GAF and ANTAR domain-containing protein n=1 Tax=Streptomyces sp. NPDC090106 TaxID=3365946 RepID=UPI00381DAA54